MLGGHVPEPPARIADEEEGDDLEHPFALPRVHVADVPELAEQTAGGAGLLGHLAERGLLRAFARPDEALRQRPDPLLARGTDCGHHPASS